MRRNAGPLLLLAMATGLFGGFVWLTRNPDSVWVEKAQDWPLVGAIARGFRHAYLGPPPESQSAAKAAEQPEPLTLFVTPPPVDSEPRTQTPSPRQLPSLQGRKIEEPPPAPSFVTVPEAVEPTTATQEVAQFRFETRRAPRAQPEPRVRYVASQWKWFMPGQSVLASASPSAGTLADLDAMAYLPVLSRNGNWAQVVYRDREGWIDTAWQPAHSRKKARRGILRHRAEPVRPNDLATLNRARKIMGIDKPKTARLGAYTLYTDIRDEKLLALLDNAAKAAEEAYFARYGRLPSGDPQRSVVLFSKEAHYRELSKSTELSGTQVGHAGSGVLAFFVEGRTPEDLARTLVHEITHLLNDRALAWNLPPWLEEGLASDLGGVWVEDSPSVASAAAASDEWSPAIQSPEIRLWHLKELLDAGRLPLIPVLLSLDREKFHQAELESYAYSHSFAFIRFLVEGHDGRYNEGFLTFLQRIAAGLQADLLKLLEVDLDELERHFRGWLGAEVRRGEQLLEQRIEQRYGRR